MAVSRTQSDEQRKNFRELLSVVKHEWRQTAKEYLNRFGIQAKSPPFSFVFVKGIGRIQSRWRGLRFRLRKYRHVNADGKDDFYRAWRRGRTGTEFD